MLLINSYILRKQTMYHFKDQISIIINNNKIIHKLFVFMIFTRAPNTYNITLHI